MRTIYAEVPNKQCIWITISFLFLKKTSISFFCLKYYSRPTLLIRFLIYITEYKVCKLLCNKLQFVKLNLIFFVEPFKTNYITNTHRHVQLRSTIGVFNAKNQFLLSELTKLCKVDENFKFLNNQTSKVVCTVIISQILPTYTDYAVPQPQL